MDDQQLAEEQKNELSFNIKLEEKVEQEKKNKYPRRSERMAKKKQEKQTNEAYDAYLISIQH